MPRSLRITAAQLVFPVETHVWFAALTGLGVALLPSWLAGADLRAARLVQVLPAWEAAIAPGSRSIWGIYPPKKTVSPKVRVFLDFLEAHFGRPPYWERPDP